MEEELKTALHITSGDIAGNSLEKSSISGNVFVWHDILYDGPRKPGWPDTETLAARAKFSEEYTGKGLSRQQVLETSNAQYARLKTADQYDRVVLWFDACLFDQSMLCHILMCMQFLGLETADLLCVDSFPGIEPYHGLGQLSPEQFSSVYDQRQPLTKDQFLFAEQGDQAFALQDFISLKQLSGYGNPPLPWVPAAITRWIAEQPDDETGLSLLEKLALAAIHSGCETPSDIYSFVSAKDTPPQFWGDITLWGKINALAERKPPLIRIKGPGGRLPQWEGVGDLTQFRIYPVIRVN